MVIRPFNKRFLGHHMFSRFFMEVSFCSNFLMGDLVAVRRMDSKCKNWFRGACNVKILPIRT